MKRQFITTLTAICVGVTALSGCSRSPKVSFYTLGSAAKTNTVKPSKKVPSVYLMSITLPDMVDRPQLVERIGGNRVEILETHQWAEPLKKGILRLLAENLAAQLGSDLVSAYPHSPVIEPDYRVSVDIKYFESIGELVTLDAVWSVRRTASGMPITGRSKVKESRGSGGFEALVAAYNRAIASLSNDIAQSIHMEWTSVR